MKEEQKIYDTVILGGGPGGYTAALYAARAGFDTLLLERLGAGGQMATTPEIDNYPGFPDGVDGFLLAENMKRQAERFGAKTKYAEATRVSLTGEVKRIEAGGEEILSRTVIIATGAEPRALGVAGERELVGRGVSYCAHCDGGFFRGKTVAVVGGGNTAAADALYLSRVAKKVFLVHRRDTLRATRVYHAPLFAAENLEFCWNSTVKEILSDGRVTGVRLLDVQTREEREIALDGVFVSVGRVPATELFREQVALDEAGYVLAGEDTKTNLAGVFAVGDVRKKPLRQIVTATADGAVAVAAVEEYLT